MEENSWNSSKSRKSQERQPENKGVQLEQFEESPGQSVPRAVQIRNYQNAFQRPHLAQDYEL